MRDCIEGRFNHRIIAYYSSHFLSSLRGVLGGPSLLCGSIYMTFCRTTCWSFVGRGTTPNDNKVLVTFSLITNCYLILIWRISSPTFDQINWILRSFIVLGHSLSKLLSGFILPILTLNSGTSYLGRISDLWLKYLLRSSQ